MHLGEKFIVCVKVNDGVEVSERQQEMKWSNIIVCLGFQLSELAKCGLKSKAFN